MRLHAAVEERLARLAPDQRAAAMAPAGPVLCVAPAGSGKTTTLVARVCWLVAGGADPSTITAVTFNKRAADELGERLTAALAPLASTVVPRVRTFHALGREILADAGVPVRNLTDRAEALRHLNRGRPLPGTLMRRLDDGFSRLKLDLCLDATDARRMLAGDEPLPLERDVLERFIAYESLLVSSDALDFDDLVRRALVVLRSDAAILAAWRARCTTLLVDEVQDVDRSQLELAVLLAGERRDVFLVGDDDQTIYAWRLADVRRVLDLAASLPGLQRVDLVTNYRCPRPVVERAVRLIEGNSERFAKTIQAGPSADGSLVLAPDPGDELARSRRLLTRWLDDPQIDELLAALDAQPSAAPAVALARRTGGRELARALISWSVNYRTAAAVRAAVDAARQRRAALRRDDAQLILATAHGTKGLEFDHVACIGLDQHVFPGRRTLEEASDPHRALEEERRLAYVAWTRAKKSLLLVYDPTAPSPFMREAFSDAELGLLPA